MFFWILQISVVSILFILLVHHLITYFKTTLTVPKIKDLVNKPSKKYEEMFSVMYSNKEKEVNTKGTTDMKSELKNFLKEKLQKEPEPQESTPISSFPLASSDYF
jgi:hypothetical protein